MEIAWSTINTYQTLRLFLCLFLSPLVWWTGSPFAFKGVPSTGTIFLADEIRPGPAAQHSVQLRAENIQVKEPGSIQKFGGE
jgi:hypothetical protein